MKKCLLTAILCGAMIGSNARQLAPTPPMGFMSWNYFATSVNAKDPFSTHFSIR
ncbi:MAG TPA: hypothetical protein VFX43_11540 [Chitinophagaceae bacterium]|nr:hypothetical protein [Chitinophagaceae bacterium]